MKKVIKWVLAWIVCKLYRIETGRNVQLSWPIHVAGLGGVKIGNNATLSSNTLLLLVCKGAIVEFGNGVRIAHHLQISSANKVEIQDDVNIAPYVFISDHNHEYRDIALPIKNQGITCPGTVVIGRGTWIGTKATIVGNVKIGRNCVIGANAVVTKDIPDYSVVAGVPAKIVRKYNLQTGQWEKPDLQPNPINDDKSLLKPL